MNRQLFRKRVDELLFQHQINYTFKIAFHFRYVHPLGKIIPGAHNKLIKIFRAIWLSLSKMLVVPLFFIIILLFFSFFFSNNFYFFNKSIFIKIANSKKITKTSLSLQKKNFSFGKQPKGTSNAFNFNKFFKFQCIAMLPIDIIININFLVSQNN